MGLLASMLSWRTFYATPPQRAIALDELQDAALQRIQVLRQLSSWPLTDRNLPGRGHLPEPARSIFQAIEEDDALDCIGHFALRLAFGGGREWSEWLVGAESKLTMFRLRAVPPTDTIALLRHHGHVFQTKRVDSDHRQSAVVDATIELHEVPFQYVSKLVGRRGMLLDRGSCWVPTDNMYHIAVYHFKEALRYQLSVMRRTLPLKRVEMERLRPLIDDIRREAMIIDQHLHSNGSRRGGGDELIITPNTVDDIAAKHFPPCMQHLHEKFRQNHHLKFDGRVQYRVFLKGSGFSVHDSIQFFRSEFIKVIPPAKFDREYVYHIRHSYGLEGSRKDYAPMDCEKIIHGSAPRHGQYHGCPFKHWDLQSLQTELRRRGVSSAAFESVERLVAQGRHQQACITCFDATHREPFHSGGDNATTPMHPNDWVRASWGQRSTHDY